MKAVILTFAILTLFSFEINSQDMNAETIVQDQLEAYNSRNLDEFISYYSADIEIFNFQENEPFIQGIEHLKQVYKEVFENSPELHAKIDKRIVFDNKVIDHEKVTGRKGVDFIEVIAIYEIKNDLIAKVTFIRKEKPVSR